MSLYNINPEPTTGIRQSYGLNNSGEVPKSTTNSGGRTSYSKYILSNILNLASIKSDSVASKNNYINSVTLTLSPQAIRNHKFDFFTGKFDEGYPFNDRYFFCDQNLASIFQYGRNHFSRISTFGHYPTSTSLTVIDGQAIQNACANPVSCNLTCPSGQYLDPTSCICVTPPECVDQPECSPTTVPLDLKPIIKGYAFYVNTQRNLSIPGVGDVPTSCWGGHTCCSTIFRPTLITSGKTYVANKSVSMNNVSVCPIGLNQTAVPGFIPNNPYEKSDTFQFVLDDASEIDSTANVYLECQLPHCHEGVTMVYLVAETLAGDSVLIFASCLVPGALGAKPLGTVDCPGPTTLCDPPPPPSPSNCAVECINVNFSQSTPPRAECDPPAIYGTQTITIPSNISLPAYVTLTGSANDVLVIDGEVVDAGQTIQNPWWMPGQDCPVNAGNYSFVCNNRTFTIACGDSVGSGSGYSYEICMTDCPPSSALSVGQNIGVFNLE